MARINVGSTEVQQLVEQLIVPLYLELGTVTAAAEALNAALTGDAPPIHQNRLHTILSDALDRGLNAQSLESLRLAAARMLPRSAQRRTLDEARLTEVGNRIVAATGGASPDKALIAERLSMPVAVVRIALASIGESGSTAIHLEADPVASGAPDWTYQDKAVADCLDAFRRRPHGNIGLILPTGAGKTRTAFRIILETLARNDMPDATAIWVTHRKSLHAQAMRELDKLLAAEPAVLPPNAVELAARVRFVMLSEAVDAIEKGVPPSLVVIDEAHHAAAPTYQPIFQAEHPFPVLLLTATPNRPDLLPIGIDEIAFTITYRELAERGAIITPQFEALPVEDFDFSEKAVDDLVDMLIMESADRFKKTMVLVTRREQMRMLYERLAAALDGEGDHPLRASDVGFIDGGGNSHGLDNEDFLALFGAKSRAIVISAQMLLEGYDDPRIDAVVITYKTESVIKLMQAAGRCVRYAPGKTQAWVVQADNPALAYRFDQRWLYQEIDDRLLPELRDCDFADMGELLAEAASLLAAHNIDARARAQAMETIASADLDHPPRLMFYGLPYFGEAEDFDSKATWGVFVETQENSALFRSVYNRFSQMGAERSDPSEFLDVIGPTLGMAPTDQRFRRQMIGVLTAAYFAHEELTRVPGAAQGNRGYVANHSTTWLRYVTLRYRPALPQALSAFLSDCHNRGEIERAFVAEPQIYGLALKTSLPFGGSEALLLTHAQKEGLNEWLDMVREALRLVPPREQLAHFALVVARLVPPHLPQAHFQRVERLLSEDGRSQQTLDLSIPSEGTAND